MNKKIKITHLVTFFIALYLATSGIRAASVLGYGALEAGYDPQVLKEICKPVGTLRLGPVGCMMTKTMLKAGKETVIFEEEAPSCS